MFPVGRHQVVRGFVSLGIYHIILVSSYRGMSRNERYTSILFGSFVPSRVIIVFHQQALITEIH